ncbi:MAG: DUF2142 domain-containing protein [Oscillospiraceae bacterium]|nr:DUF2142 domain-containing protein [Oscillospiraceae bacterium]
MRKQKLIRILLTVIIAMAIAVLVEILFSTIKRSKQPEQYEMRYFADGDFLAVEYLAEQNRYLSLANDSYFEIENIGGIAAQSIDIYLTRPEQDCSEMVLRFDGISRGVIGSFTVGMKPVDENTYRAIADFDAIYGIRIYPTEVTSTLIIFSGIEINRVTTYVEFSCFRVLLWLSLLLTLRQLLMSAVSYRKNREWDISWQSIYIVTLSVVALFAFVSQTIYSTPRLIGDILIPISMLCFSAVYGFIYIMVKRIRQTHTRAFLLFLVAGIAFTFASAPLQVPDEANHFARCYTISTGSLRFSGDFEFPDEVTALYDNFTENLKMYELYHAQPTATQRMQSYLSKGSYRAEDSDRAQPYSNALLILPYLPAAVAIAVVSLFTKSALAALYAARLINVVMVSFAVGYALKNAVRNHIAIMLTAFFPLSVFMAASTSYDAMLIASFLVFIGIISKEEIVKTDILLLVAAFAIIVQIKPLYLPLALLLFTIPQNSLKPKANIYAIFGLMLVVGVAVWQLSLLYARSFSHNIIPSHILIGVDKSAQIGYILKNPLRFLMVVFVDGFRSSFYISEYGLFGHLDLATQLTSILTPIQLVLCSSLSYSHQTEKDKRRKNTVFLLILFLLMYIVTAAGFYVVDSSLGGSTILGIQARYFIPSIFIASLTLSNLSREIIRANSTRRTVSFTLFSSFFLAIVAACEVFAGYYLS